MASSVPRVSNSHAIGTVLHGAVHGGKRKSEKDISCDLHPGYVDNCSLVRSTNASTACGTRRQKWTIIKSACSHDMHKPKHGRSDEQLPSPQSARRLNVFESAVLSNRFEDNPSSRTLHRRISAGNLSAPCCGSDSAARAAPSLLASLLP